jgi:hypothetical protein
LGKLGFTGLMSLGHAAFFGLGAYAVAILGTLFGINAWLALAAGVVIAAAGLREGGERQVCVPRTSSGKVKLGK